jgi:hypothetical protein
MVVIAGRSTESLAIMWHATVAIVALASAAPVLSIEEVEASLQSRGGRATINQYFQCDESGYAAYERVESGSARWLDVAVRLLDDSDACVTLSLTSAIATALPKAPSRVLKLLDTKPALRADRLCVPFLSEDDDPRKQLRYLRTAEATLIAFDGTALKAQRDTCLREVKEATAAIARSLTTRRSGP